MVKFAGGLICVKDIQRSRRLYEELLEQTMLENFGENIVYMGFSLQEKRRWASFLDVAPVDIKAGCYDHELYFETEDLYGFIEKMKAYDVKLYQPIQVSNWGQRMIRFFDYDDHMIEVGESKDYLMLNYIKQGHSVEETHEKYQFSIDYINNLLKRQIS